MPPQSAIGVQQSDGTIKAIMLYNDDRRSPAHVILSGWYNSQKKAEELLSLGHLSRLGEKIAPEFGEHHSFDKPQPNTVIAYHRDRGDAGEPYFVYKNLDDFAARCHYDMAITSIHVWVDGTYLCRLTYFWCNLRLVYAYFTIYIYNNRHGNISNTLRNI